MGMIFQEYALVERLTVMENVLSGRLGYVNFWQSLFRKYQRIMFAKHIASGSRRSDAYGRQAC